MMPPSSPSSRNSEKSVQNSLGIKRLEKIYLETKRRRQFIKKSISERKSTLLNAVTHAESCESALKLIQEFTNSIQSNAHKHVSDLVTNCLKIVYGKNAYEFLIKFGKKRSATEAEFVFKRKSLEVDPVTAAGLGMVDVASFSLRVASVVFTPGQRRLFILDEPFKWVEVGVRSRLAEMIQMLSDKFQAQFIIVTHIEDFKLGKIITIGESR